MTGCVLSRIIGWCSCRVVGLESVTVGVSRRAKKTMARERDDFGQVQRQQRQERDAKRRGVPDKEAKKQRSEDEWLLWCRSESD